MIEVDLLPRRIAGRAETAAKRALCARAMLADCRLCAHDCGVNRLAGEKGLCHAGATANFFSAQVEVSDELELIPTFALALSGCDLRCDFCITGQSSWNAQAGSAFDAKAMAVRAEAALQDGAKTIMILGGEPTIHLPEVLDFISHLPDSARLVWKTNAHGSIHSRELIEGLFDLHLADFKFGNDQCAQRLARVPDYLHIIRENLLWATSDGDLMVRHLLMPGHIDCCWKPVAEWLAAELPDIKVNLRTGFWPAWKTMRHAELGGMLTEEENCRAHRIAHDLDLNLIS